MAGLAHDSYLSLDGLQPPPELRGHLKLGSLNFFHAISQLIFSRSYCKMHA